MSFARIGSAVLVLAFLGCATAEPVDDTGVAFGGTAGAGAGSGGKVDNPNDGGASGGGGAGSGGAGGDTGGGAGLGGSSASGGAPSGGTGGTPSGGSGGSGSGCPTGQKKCGGVCIPPSPGVGCSDTDCTPCPNPPPNANSMCSGTLCDFTCLSGYVKSGSTCVSTGGGGGGGVGGSGGGGSGTGGGGGGCPAPCDPSDAGAQFLCAFFCAASGQSIGLCAPVLNCCTCTS